MQFNSNIKFDEQIAIHIIKAQNAANATGENQFVYMHLDGWVDFGTEEPMGITRICEIFPGTERQIPKAEDRSDWIRVNDTAWLYLPDCSWFQISHSGQEMSANIKGEIKIISCKKEVVLAELQRLNFPLGDNQDESTNNRIS